MKRLSGVFRKLLAAAVLSAPAAALAQSNMNAGEWADSMSGQTGSFMNLALQVGFLIGVIVFLVGINLLYKDHKQPGQDHGKKGLVALGVGSAFLAAPFLIDVGTSTVANGQQGGTEYVQPNLQ